MRAQNKFFTLVLCLLTTVSYADNNYLGYVDWIDGSIRSCTIGADDQLTNCSSEGFLALKLQPLPTLININPEHTLAYITSVPEESNSGTGLIQYKCNINKNNKLNNCSVAMDDAEQTTSGPAFNKTGNTAYILSVTHPYTPPFNMTILQCPVNTNGNISKNSCRNSGAIIDPNLASEVTLTINPAQTFIYYTPNSPNTPEVSSIAQCAIDQKDGSLRNCHQLNLPATYINDLEFDPAGTHAYITTSYDVTICDANKDNGDLTNCHGSGISGGLETSGRIFFNATGDKAYVQNYGYNSIATCSVDQKNALFTACTFS
jgi:hypothetical protein